MNAFRDWYVRNQDAITWFIIGILTGGMADHIARQQYTWALVNAGLIYINYRFSRVRMT
jgi:hypothetical protein